LGGKCAGGCKPYPASPGSALFGFFKLNVLALHIKLWLFRRRLVSRLAVLVAGKRRLALHGVALGMYLRLYPLASELHQQQKPNSKPIQQVN
jgi:hypothetical protein